MSAVRKLCLFGLSGCGKSTLAGMLQAAVNQRGESAAVIKLADPLYRLQRAFYAAADVDLRPGKQDQVLLENIAENLRRISPTSIVDDFAARLGECTASLVINEDLRDPHTDYRRLRDLGFTFVRVTADESVRLQRLIGRGDLTSVADSKTTNDIHLIGADLVIDNSGRDLDRLRTRIVPDLLEYLDRSTTLVAPPAAVEP